MTNERTAMADGQHDLDRKIQIFHSYILDYQLDIADLVINGKVAMGVRKWTRKPIPKSEIATLMIALAYFEMIGRARSGYTRLNKGETCFIDGVKAVFRTVGNRSIEKLNSQKTRDALVKMYTGMRCGLYHLGIPGKGIVVASSGSAIVYVYESDTLIVNPRLLVRLLREHLDRFCEELRKPRGHKKLRADFEKWYDVAFAQARPD